MDDLLAKYFSVALAASIKFIGGIIAGSVHKMSVLETAIATFTGCMFTITVISFFGNRLWLRIKKRFLKLKKGFYQVILFLLRPFLSSDNYEQKRIKFKYKLKPRIFTSSTRLAVKVWQLFGIGGISILTPLLFSPFGGAVLSVSFRVPFKKIMIYMSITHFALSFLFAFLFNEFGGFIENLFGLKLSG